MIGKEILQVYKMRIYLAIFLLAFFITACGSSTATTVPTPTGIPVLEITPSLELTSTLTSAPTWQLPGCDQVPPQVDLIQSYKLLYTNANQVFTWDQSSQQVNQLPLPQDAIAPQVSSDGRYIAYLLTEKSVDTLAKNLDSIPLMIFDRQNSESWEIADFSTVKMRQLYPESPVIKLELEWLPGGYYLIVQVNPVPWGEGVPQPTGDIFLVSAKDGSVEMILPAGGYEYFSIAPDGNQLAFMDSKYLTEIGSWDQNALQDGKIILVDIPALTRSEFQIFLPSNPWSFTAPIYSPDGNFTVNQVESGLLFVETYSFTKSFVQLENPCETSGCYWGGSIPVTWSPDSLSLIAITYKNDFFDQRAETTLSKIDINSAEATSELIINVNPFTIGFSPDLKQLIFWNQDDIDTGSKDFNHVSMKLMDMETGNVIQYATEYLLRIKGWSPDNSHFLYTFSRYGGPNPVPDLMALGGICNSPIGLFVPNDQLIDSVRWLDDQHFLAWTFPDDGIPDVYFSGLYFYSLDQGVDPIKIDNLLQDFSDPYGMESQVLILDE